MEEGQLALLIPIFGIVFGVGAAIVGILASHRARVARLEYRHKERLAAIDKGLELPPDGLDPELDPRHRRPRYLLRGLVWLFSGLGFGTFLYTVADPDVSTLALIPAGIGLAYLIFYFVEGKRESAAVLPPVERA